MTSMKKYINIVLFKNTQSMSNIFKNHHQTPDLQASSPRTDIKILDECQPVESHISCLLSK